MVQEIPEKKFRNNTILSLGLVSKISIENIFVNLMYR